MKKFVFGVIAAAAFVGIGGFGVYASEVSDAYINIQDEADASNSLVDGLSEDPEYLKRQNISVSPIMSSSAESGYTGGTYYHSSVFDSAKIRNGIDVSYYQGFIDWEKVKAAGIDFAFIRVAYRGYGTGALVTDPSGTGNISAAVEQGIRVGVYIFSQAITVEEAIAEADYAIDAIGSNDISLPVVMDYEYAGTGQGRLYNAGLSSEQTTEIINAFCNRVRERGYTPMLYANKNMLEDDINSSELNCEVWLANYTNETSYQGKYSVWQYSSSGYVDGISGLVDCDFAYDYSDDYAYEQTIKNGIYNIKLSSNSNYALDICGGTDENSANLQLWDFSGNEAQQFEVKYIADGRYYIKAVCSDKYLDAQGSDIKAGTNVAQYQYNGGSNQQWYIESAGDGSYRIRSAVNQMCLDVANATAAPSSNILLWTGNSNSLQTFKFLEYYEVNTEYVKEGYNGWYRINNASYWYDDGIMARDKEVYDPESDAWYWFDADGRMAVDKDAFIPTNADRTEGKWVRYDENGSMKKGEDYRYGGWYWFDPVTGEMIKGFVYIPVDGASEGKWVYYDEITGQMHHGESCIDGNWYYFDEYTGKMAHGESYHDGNWYYYDEITGIMRYGEVTLPNGETAYYDEITGVRR
jgi:GH25 family lysozyme M1 (1,4-beta-N-acetylmuramidase)